MSATSFTLKWLPSESDGGSQILEYIVEMKDASSKKEFKKLGSTKGDITDIPVNYLEKDHGYKFRITARNSIGISDPYLPEETIIAGSRISKYMNKIFRFYCCIPHKLFSNCFLLLRDQVSVCKD